MLHENSLMVQEKALTEFCIQVFQTLGVPEEDARIASEVLVAADLRGVESHGVARLRRYVSGIRAGSMVVNPEVKVVSETSTTALIDAGGALGQPVSYRAMQKAIQKAVEAGSGFVAVRNSNHYGIAGYYAMMALEYDCIGVSMTNADARVVPTFGRNGMLGTNPIAIAAPAKHEYPFVLDMATSTVPLGKLEVYGRLGKSMPLGWATDERGVGSQDTNHILKNIRQYAGGGLLPLGGEGETFGGHKGYGLAMLVEIFCGILSGAAYANLTYPKTSEGKPLPPNIGHFFGAWKVDSFRPVDEFKIAMDDLQQLIKNSPKAEGHNRIYIHGEKEFENMERFKRDGIPLNPKVKEDLKAIANETGTKWIA